MGGTPVIWPKIVADLRKVIQLAVCSVSWLSVSLWTLQLTYSRFFLNQMEVFKTAQLPKQRGMLLGWYVDL